MPLSNVQETEKGDAPARNKDTKSHRLICINVQNLIQRGLQAELSPDGREDPTHTHRQRRQRDGASAGSNRAFHEQRPPPESVENQRREKEGTTLAEPGRQRCGTQALQRDKKQEHNKTLDEITLDLSGIPLTHKMGNPLTRDPSLLL